MRLEELARQSTNDARASVAHLEAPPMQSGSPKRSWTPLVAGVAVSALVVGGLAVLARDRGGDAPTEIPPVAQVPRLGLELDGWTVSFAGSFADLGIDGERPSFAYYGDSASTDDPYATGDLVIAGFTGGDSQIPALEAEDGTTIELRGTTATVSHGLDHGLPDDVTSLNWRESNADGVMTEVVLLSHSFDETALVDIAEALDVDAGTVTPSDDLGLDRVATARSTPFDALSRTGEGYLVAYQNLETDDVALISTARGRLSDEIAVMRWWTDQVTDIEIDGRPGFLATFDDPMSDLGRTVTWSPADGVIASVSRFMGGDEPDVVALAAAAFEIDDETWETYLAASETVRSGAEEFDEIYGQGSGTLDDVKYSWVLGIQSDSLCIAMQSVDGGSTSCQAPGSIDVPEGGARTIDNEFGPQLARVLIAADPLVETIVETTGTYTIGRVESDGVSWFVAVGDSAIQPSFNVIVGGEVVDTVQAAVEAVEAVEPALATNPAALELGIADLDAAVDGSTRDGFFWWLGRNEPDLCLVTDGVNPAAACQPAGDIVVFAPVSAPDRELTFVVVVDTPDCIESISIGEVDGGGPIGDFFASGRDEQHVYRIYAMFGSSDSWVLEVDVAGVQQVIELPAVEGSVAFPPSLCDS